MKGTFWRGCGLAFFCFWHGSAQGRAAAVLFSLSDDEKSSIRALRLLTEVTLFSNLMPRSSRLYAGVAQLVEQRIRNAKVAGSTPVSGTSYFKPVALIPLFFLILWDRFVTAAVPSYSRQKTQDYLLVLLVSLSVILFANA